MIAVLPFLLPPLVDLAAGSRCPASAAPPEAPSGPLRVLVGCPAARPPAYAAVAGLARAARLDRFLTASYYAGAGLLAALPRRLAPGGLGRLHRVLHRRHDPEIPRRRVGSVPSFDMALALARRLGPHLPQARR